MTDDNLLALAVCHTDVDAFFLRLVLKLDAVKGVIDSALEIALGRDAFDAIDLAGYGYLA